MFAALLSAVKGPERYFQFLHSRERLAEFLGRSLERSDLYEIVTSLIEVDSQLLGMWATNCKIRSLLAQDVAFLIDAVLADKTKTSFFSSGRIRDAAASFTSIRNEIAKDHNFLVEMALRDDQMKKFFSDGRIRDAAISFTSIRNEVVRDLNFMVEAVLHEDRKKAFFSDRRIRDAAVSFTSIREEVAQDSRFLISSSLTEQNQNRFYQDANVQKAFERINPPNEKSAIRVLSSSWTNRQRQLNGFGLYLSMLDKLKDYYGDSETMTRLADAPLPVEGFPSDLHLRDFLCTHLCEDDKFYMRDAKLQIVDTHAMWTLINEILIDQEYFFESDAEAPFIIDCGANFGMSTIYFKQLYPKAHVLAFEPVPWLCKMAAENVASNGFSNVEIIEKGLSARAGESQFYISQNYSMAGSLTDRRLEFGDNIETISINTVPLSKYINREVDFLKIDIEGSEGEVLMELGDKLSSIKQMCVEWHLHPASDESVRLDQVLTLLADHGFDYQIGKSGNYAKKSRIRPMTHVGDMGTLNFWAARR